MSPRHLFLLAIGISSPAYAAEDFVPTAQDISRYEHIWKSSPFVSAAEPVKQSESLVNRIVLTGFANINGKDVAFLFDRTDLRRFAVAAGEKSKTGVELVSVDNRGRLRDSTVRVKVGTDVGDIKYDAGSAGGISGGEGVPSPELTSNSPQIPPPPQGQVQNSGSSSAASSAEPQRPRIVPKRFVRRLAQ